MKSYNNPLTITAIAIIVFGIIVGLIKTLNKDLYDAILFFQAISIVIGSLIIIYQKKDGILKLWQYIKPINNYFINSLYLRMIVIYALSLAFGIYFANRNGFEGDDIVQIDGIVNAAEYGSEAYRYHLHPLSFELNRLIYYIFNDIELLYITPAIFGSIGISFLSATIYLHSKKQLSIGLSFALLFILPELFMTMLYYNSTAFAMAFFGISLFLVYSYRDKPKKYLALSSGVIFAISCLFRIDFCLGLPMIIYIYLQQNKNLKTIIPFLLGGLIILIISLIFNIFAPQKLLDILNFHSIENVTKLWGLTLENMIFNFFSLTPLVVWLCIYFYSILFLVKNIKLKQWINFLILIPLVFLLYPIKLLGSPKYLVPLLFFIPLLLADIIDNIKSKINPKYLKYGLLTFILFMQFYSIEVKDNYFPYLRITREPQKIYTHDGLRYTGAYLQGYHNVRETRDKPFPELGWQLFSLIESSPASFILVFPKHPNLLFWPAYNRALALYLQKKGYNRIKNDKGDIILSKNNKKITITYNPPPTNNKAIILIVPNAMYDDPKLANKIQNFISNTKKLIRNTSAN